MSLRTNGRGRHTVGDGHEEHQVGRHERADGDAAVDSAVDRIEPGGTSTMSGRTGAARRAMIWTVGIVMVFAAALAGCSSGGDGEDGVGSDPLDGDDRDTYVVAFEEAGRDPVTGEMTEEASCVAEAIVDGVGVDQMRDVATPREIADAANGQGASLASLGVEVDTDQADAIYEGIEGCGDVAATFLDAIPGPQLAGPVAECFKEQLDDGLLREIVMTRLVEGDEAFVDDAEITSQLTAIGRTCAAGGAQ